MTAQVNPTLQVARNVFTVHRRSKRAKQACTHCRAYKLRCEMPSDGVTPKPIVCLRCQKEGLKCAWVEISNNKGKGSSIIAGRAMGPHSTNSQMRTDTLQLAKGSTPQELDFGTSTFGDVSGSKSEEVRNHFLGNLSFASTLPAHEANVYPDACQAPEQCVNLTTNDLFYIPQAFAFTKMGVSTEEDVIAFLFQTVTEDITMLDSLPLGNFKDPSHEELFPGLIQQPEKFSSSKFEEENVVSVDCEVDLPLTPSSATCSSLQALQSRQRIMSASVSARNRGLIGDRARIETQMAGSNESSDYLKNQLATILEHIHVLIFSSSAETNGMTIGNSYEKEIQNFLPRLRGWKHDFDKLDMSLSVSNELYIEYEYTQVYLHSISLQAQILRQQYLPVTPLSPISNHHASIITLIRASRNLISAVAASHELEDILNLQTARLHSRMLFATVMLLKSFSIPSEGKEIRASLDCIARSEHILRTFAPEFDSVHQPFYLSNLLNSLTRRVYRGLVPFKEFRMPTSQSSDANLA